MIKNIPSITSKMTINIAIGRTIGIKKSKSVPVYLKMLQKLKDEPLKIPGSYEPFAGKGVKVEGSSINKI